MSGYPRLHETCSSNTSFMGGCKFRTLSLLCRQHDCTAKQCRMPLQHDHEKTSGQREVVPLALSHTQTMKHLREEAYDGWHIYVHTQASADMLGTMAGCIRPPNSTVHSCPMLDMRQTLWCELSHIQSMCCAYTPPNRT